MKDDFSKTRKEYIKRISNVLDFIEKNLESDLSLETLSKKAYYSPFHFHRVFSTIVGENLNNYVNRKRIERIASILITSSEKTIKELAYFYGFKSESSFSRSFKKHYQISPSRFKSEGKNILSKIGIEPFRIEGYICSIDQINKWNKMNSKINITELEEIRLAGIMHIGEFEKMKDVYQKLMKWGHNASVLDTSNFKAITIYHDNPNVAHFSKTRYSACLTVSKEIQAEGEVRPISIQKGFFVVARFEIKGEDISVAWKNVCIWVMENGYEFRDDDYFEVYHNDHKTHPELKFIIDICIPIKRTQNMNLDRPLVVNFSYTKENNSEAKKYFDYHQVVDYMKELRAFFHKEYTYEYKLGKINPGSKDYTYFSLTPAELKKLKLKFVVIFDHILNCFTICLSGQNKSVRKKYWHMFKVSDWDKYHLAESIHRSLMIIDYKMVEDPDFRDLNSLTQQIEKESLNFMNEFRALLE